MSQEDVNFLSEEGNIWRCDPCNRISRKSMRLEHSNAEGSVTLDSIMAILKDIQDKQKINVADFNKSNKALHTALEENTGTLKEGMEKVERYVKEIDDLKNESSALRAKVVELEARVEDLESYTRRNCMEIQGLPEEKDEDVLELVKKVGTALQVKIEDHMVDACHRVGKRLTRDHPRGIIVKFVRRTDKELLMKRRREKKRDFSTRHLDLPTDTPIYLNDSLSPAKRKLLPLAREAKKNKNYKYLWLRNGNILMRKEDEQVSYRYILRQT